MHGHWVSFLIAAFIEQLVALDYGRHGHWLLWFMVGITTPWILYDGKEMAHAQFKGIHTLLVMKG